MIHQAATSEEFVDLRFLSACDEKMINGVSFPESWASSVSEDMASLGKEASPIISGLSNVLGRSDLESQLSAIDYGIAMLEARLLDAREYASRHKKLYQTLGVLAGLGLAVFMV